MGLKYGAYKLLEKLQRGQYRRHKIQIYTIYIDGELMRYKGMVATNLSLHNACEAITNTSFSYMMNMVRAIDQLINTNDAQRHIVVYMDGRQRVRNKVIRTNTSTNQFDTQLIRDLFTAKCVMSGCITIKALQEGESELQMYLQRDRSNDLNIFVTSDSDMIAILYNHEPNVLTSSSGDLATIADVDDNERIATTNQVYSPECSEHLIDSCLWVNCSYKVFAVGCDFNGKSMGFLRHIFLIFVGMCGTDFTENMLTETMIGSILKMSTADMTWLNSLTEVVDIVVALVYLGVKYGGTLKPKNRRYESASGDGSLHDYVFNIDMYCRYIETGIMGDEVTRVVNIPHVCRHIFTDLGYTGTSFKRSELETWTHMNHPADAIMYK